MDHGHEKYFLDSTDAIVVAKQWFLLEALITRSKGKENSPRGALSAPMRIETRHGEGSTNLLQVKAQPDLSNCGLNLLEIIACDIRQRWGTLDCETRT